MRWIVWEKINFVEGEVEARWDCREKITVRLQEDKKCLPATISPATFCNWVCDPECLEQAAMRKTLIIDGARRK
jgi:hypothetical protein